ncbi:hypothetical protein B0H16DRAFT_1461294 [Mycena metata]|uniref:Uncharacterized protein n=1 Tax=Mycena metata TaxID=1033252 RepID=A0AAD7IRS4_9AGAR|nr:hypothetical protein B0H16DRAFT_1461294 [Mycena metata]
MTTVNYGKTLVRPSPIILERFWGRISSVSSRHHDVDNRWVGEEEVRIWNNANRGVRPTPTKACDKCANGKGNRICVVDEYHATCRPCRALKIGCDRKTRFLYDMTKEEFFSNYSRFLQVYQNKEGFNSRNHVKVTGGALDLTTQAKAATKSRARASGLARHKSSSDSEPTDYVHVKHHAQPGSFEGKVTNHDCMAHSPKIW